MMINFHIFLLLSFLAILMTLISLANQTKHVIMILMLLETMALSVFLLITYNMGMVLNNFSSLIFFLTLSVCEASLGLAALVSVLRAHGNDYVSTLTMKSF